MIVQKKHEHLMEAIRGDDQQEERISDLEVKDSFPGADDKVQIEIDAQIRTYKTVPVFRVVPRDITEEEVHHLMDVLVGDDVEWYEPKRNLSKSEIEEQILQYQQWIGNREYLEEEYDSDETAIEQTIQNWQKEMAYYESLYDSASPQMDREGLDWHFHSTGYYDRIKGDENHDRKGIMEIRGEGMMGEDRVSLLAVNRNASDYQNHLLEYTRILEDPDTSRSISSEQVKAGIESILSEADIGDWIIGDMEEIQHDDGTQEYSIVCQRLYEKMPARADDSRMDLHSEDMYASRIANESLVFRVLAGELVYMKWENPLEVQECLAEHADVLPWDDIYAGFQTQMQLEYTAWKAQHFAEDYGEELEPCTIRIRDVRMELVRIKEPDADGAYLLVPAWSFSGETGIEYEGSIEWASEDGNSTKEDYWYTYVTVNALDGSTINTILGY